MAAKQCYTGLIMGIINFDICKCKPSKRSDDAKELNIPNGLHFAIKSNNDFICKVLQDNTTYFVDKWS